MSTLGVCGCPVAVTALRPGLYLSVYLLVHLFMAFLSDQIVNPTGAGTLFALLTAVILLCRTASGSGKHSTNICWLERWTVSTRTRNVNFVKPRRMSENPCARAGEYEYSQNSSDLHPNSKLVLETSSTHLAIWFPQSHRLGLSIRSCWGGSGIQQPDSETGSRETKKPGQPGTP